MSAARAENAWRRVLEIDGSSSAAYDALDRIYRGSEQWDQLRTLLLRREENTLDVAALLQSFDKLPNGELVKVTSNEANVRVWIE